MAYSAGRYAQQTEPETLAAFPFWQYVHSGAVHFRPQHKGWNGITLRADDPWWDTHYGPNGWGCGCWVRPVSARKLARMGKAAPDTAPPVKMVEHVIRKTGEVIQVPEGIDPGFDYNPGKEWTGRAAQIPANATLTAKGSAPASPAPPAPAAPATPPTDTGPVQVNPTTSPKPGQPTPSIPPALAPKVPKALIPKQKPVTPEPPPAPVKPLPPALTSEPGPIAVGSAADLSAADKVLHNDYAAWGKRLSEDERDALAAYKGSFFRDMNNHLRGLLDDPSVMHDIRALTRALDRARTKRALTVHRGVGRGTPWEAAKIGDTVADAGFMSSSVNPGTAQSFGSATVSIEIRLPRGYTGGAYVNRIPNVNHMEFEFIIRPGAPFRVIERTGNRIVVEPVRGGRRRSPKLD